MRIFPAVSLSYIFTLIGPGAERHNSEDRGRLERNMSSSPAKHRVPDLITTKRNGGHLSQDEIQHFIEGIVSGDVQDVQAGKL